MPTIHSWIVFKIENNTSEVLCIIHEHIYGSPWSSQFFPYFGFLIVPIDDITVVFAPDELVDTDTTGGLSAVVVITLGFTPLTTAGCASHLVFLFGSIEGKRC